MEIWEFVNTTMWYFYSQYLMFRPKCFYLVSVVRKFQSLLIQIEFHGNPLLSPQDQISCPPCVDFSFTHTQQKDIVKRSTLAQIYQEGQNKVIVPSLI